MTVPIEQQNINEMPTVRIIYENGRFTVASIYSFRRRFRPVANDNIKF